MVYAPPAVPTVADARRAAEVLTSAGARRVLLYGSVACGEAVDGSDIDLVAIYDDIDYAARAPLACRLEAAASAAAGFPVAVFVTDRPEWRMRTTRVRTSLEALVAERGVVLVDRETGDRGGQVDWGKEMVMPSSDYEQGLYRLGRANEGLVKLANALEPGKVETLFAELGAAEEATLAQIGRMLTLGGAGHTVTEQSVKALVHLTEQRARDLKGRHIERLTDRLSDPARTRVAALLTPPGPQAITPWHWWERYHRPDKDPYPAPQLVLPVIRAACRVVSYTAGHFGQESPARAVHATVELIEDHIAVRDLLSGENLPGRS